MDQQYKFRTACSVIGFIDFFFSFLSILLLFRGDFILPNIFVLAKGLAHQYSLIWVTLLGLFIVALWTFMWIGAVQLVRATVGKTELSDSIKRIVFWRNVNIFVIVLLTVVICINGRKPFVPWVPQMMHFIFRVFGVTFACYHLSELRENLT